jgi:iron complex outermembrane receptor protein
MTPMASRPGRTATASRFPTDNVTLLWRSIVAHPEGVEDYPIMGGNMIRTLAAALATSTCLVAIATPAAAQTREFNVPAGSLRSALDAFARQSGRQVIYRGEVRSARSPGVQGARTAEDALNAILAGSGFVVKTDRSGAFAIVKAGNGQVAGRAASLGEAPTEGAAKDKLDGDIVVTGTNIRGLRASTSPIITISRSDIERSGYSNASEIANSLPQNFGGGQTGATADGQIGVGIRANMNAAGATAFNLRGLGTDSTLTLLNGTRMAPGIRGQAVDVSLIPIAAIERIDILTDGSSAIYGSDALAGVVNIVLRKDFEGAETGVRFGAVTNGGLETVTIDQTLGHVWSSGRAMLTLNYQRQGALDAADRSFSSGTARPTTLIPNFRQYAGVLTAGQNLTDKLKVDVDATFNNKTTISSLTYSPTTGYTSENEHQQFDLAGRLTYSPTPNWMFELSGTYSSSRDEITYLRSTPARAGIVIGQIAQIWQDHVYSLNLRSSGTLFQLPGGPVKLAFGGSYISESFRGLEAPSTAFTIRVDRSVKSAYGELNVPLFDGENAVAGLRRLIVNGSLRYDDYKVFGSTTNYKLGVLWDPFVDFSIRASTGTSFRAPNSQDVFASTLTSYIFTYNFASPTGPGNIPIFILQGGNYNLRPETSRNWTVGFEYRPSFLRGMQLSATYYSVDFRDRIIEPPFNVSVLRSPDVYGSLIQPLANDTASAAYLADARSRGYIFFDLATGRPGSTGIRYVYNASLQNAAVVEQSGIDLSLRYSGRVSANDRIDFAINGAVIRKISTAFAPGAVPTDLVNTYSNPPRFRGRAMATWSHKAVQMTGALNYVNAYRDISASPEGRVSPWTTVDLNLAVSPEKWTGPLANLSFGLSVMNLFDRNPPYVNGSGSLGGVHYDVGNASPLGRFISVYLRKKW